MTQLKINVIILLLTLMVNNFCHSQQTISGYMYCSESEKIFFTFEERREDTLFIYYLAAFALDKTDTLNFNNYFYVNEFISGTITKDINYFLDKYEDGAINNLWLFYEPFQINSTKIVLVNLTSKQMFIIENHSLYVRCKLCNNKNIYDSRSIVLFTDFKRLEKKSHGDQEIKADALYDIDSDEYVIENIFGDILLDSSYNYFRINKNYHITAYKIAGEWCREIRR